MYEDSHLESAYEDRYTIQADFDMEDDEPDDFDDSYEEDNSLIEGDLCMCDFCTARDNQLI